MPRFDVMRQMMVGSNMGLCTTRSIEIGRGWEHVFCAKHVMQHHTVSLKEVNYLFPLYIYPNGEYLLESFEWPEGEQGRRPNISRPFIEALTKKLKLEFVTEGRGDLKQSFGPEDVFHYIYALLHSPSYRSRYTQYLKTDFPRIPLTGKKRLFSALAGFGAELVALHLLEHVPTPKAGYPIAGDNRVVSPRYKAPDSKAPGCVYINDTQYFAPIPPSVWAFQVGGYQVCDKWLKDHKGRILDFNDIEQYRRITEALRQTLRLMKAIDARISGWPIA